MVPGTSTTEDVTFETIISVIARRLAWSSGGNIASSASVRPRKPVWLQRSQPSRLAKRDAGDPAAMPISAQRSSSFENVQQPFRFYGRRGKRF